MEGGGFSGHNSLPRMLREYTTNHRELGLGPSWLRHPCWVPLPVASHGLYPGVVAATGTSWRPTGQTRHRWMEARLHGGDGVSYL